MTYRTIVKILAIIALVSRRDAIGLESIAKNKIVLTKYIEIKLNTTFVPKNIFRNIWIELSFSLDCFLFCVILNVTRTNPSTMNRVNNIEINSFNGDPIISFPDSKL